TASAFLNSLHDFINTVRLLDGTRRYYNVNRARINGFELQAQKTLVLARFGLDALAGYTFLDHWNESDNRPLDALAKHTGTFDLGFTYAGGPRLGLTGILSSKSWYWNTSTSTDLVIPSYFSLDTVLSWRLRNFEPYVRLANLFNHYFYTEPGFPWRGRFLEFGLKTGLF
ncbi:MAG TPA: TonB-dependent receptor, partial [Burkholderiales bacterium]|nr:TonB-dependent receptor [Burkholderiales bacterium]